MRRFSILAVVFLSFFFPVFAQSGELLWSKPTEWGEVRVRQQGRTRILTFFDADGETEESRMLLDHPEQPQLEYLRQMRAVARALGMANEEPKSYLVVGLGGGSLSKALLHDHPKAMVTSIELEPVVVEAARKFFLHKDSERSRTVIDDARHFLETSAERYDLIFLDAFDGVEVPAPLRTVEFAQLLDGHLKAGGAVVANVHFVPVQPSLRYQKSLHEVFPHRYLTSGLAQGVGLFSHHPFALASSTSGVSPSPLPSLQPPSLEGVRPYRDNER